MPLVRRQHPGGLLGEQLFPDPVSEQTVVVSSVFRVWGSVLWVSRKVFGVSQQVSSWRRSFS
nr:hypothetical protein [Kibdelosporangium sp. MJ126-NF4]CTQ91305.1 hypothetical protein [Kibdelosporangium sp. MJ126-NF4]